MALARLNEREANPNPYISFISALPVRDASAQEDSRQLLRALAAQVKPLMKAHGFIVTNLEEVHNQSLIGYGWDTEDICNSSTSSTRFSQVEIGTAEKQSVSDTHTEVRLDVQQTDHDRTSPARPPWRISSRFLASEHILSRSPFVSSLTLDTRVMLKYGIPVSTYQSTYTCLHGFSTLNYCSQKTLAHESRARVSSFVGPAPKRSQGASEQRLLRRWYPSPTHLRFFNRADVYGSLGLWSSGRRLADSARVSGQGLDEGELPEYIVRVLFFLTLPHWLTVVSNSAVAPIHEPGRRHSDDYGDSQSMVLRTIRAVKREGNAKLGGV